MGAIYFGPYFEEIDTYDHEGYAAWVMPDGTETGTFGGEYGWRPSRGELDPRRCLHIIGR